MAIFSTDDLARLSAPHVARAWFLALDLPDGVVRLHNGVGRVSLGGQEWSGVTNPVGGQMVSLSNVEEPRFGQAVAVNITLSGANKAFLQSVHATRREVEGRRADLFWAAFDGETGELLFGLKRLFPGKISSPVIHWQGVGVRLVTVTIESIWSGDNFPFGGRWNDADQRRRYPDDKGLQYVGVKVQEQWQ